MGTLAAIDCKGLLVLTYPLLNFIYFQGSRFAFVFGNPERRLYNYFVHSNLFLSKKKWLNVSGKNDVGQNNGPNSNNCYLKM
jgi:hypothetical protein